MSGKMIIPRVIAAAALGFIGAFCIVAAFVKVFEQFFIFIDAHPTYTGLTVLALFAVFGIVWLIKYVKR